jgi:acetylornithine deacetylase/succinyl-diaminopimelate desuccinylase
MGKEHDPSGEGSPEAARMKALLAGLVGFASENPPGREAEVALFLGTHLKALGFAVETPEVAPGRRNVVAKFDNGDGPTLAFNSHLDVVPAGGGWTGDPFRLAERDGRLYGRGACDAKGSIAAMVEAMTLLKTARAAWQGRLIGVFVADEEVGSSGARRFVADHPPVDRVVVGEPTSLATVSAHKGVLRPRIRIAGKSAHSGMPELGENAIVAAGQLMALFTEEDGRLRKILHPLCGKASLTVTRIDGGVADNVVPASCELVIDRRVLPGETREQVEGEVRDLLDRARRDYGVRSDIVGFSSTAGGCETPISDPVVTAAVESCARHGVRRNGPLGFMGGCDLVHFAAVGSRGVVLGPGGLDVAHQPDEFVPVDELGTAAAIYRDLMLRLFRTGSLDGERDAAR